MLSEWSNYGRQHLTDEHDQGRGGVAALNVLAVCRTVACTVYICVVLDRFVDNVYSVFLEIFQGTAGWCRCQVM